ncbi:TerF-like vWA domain-containing protein [Streptomyces sp. CEV 2-1]|uniref:VWA domain-containing protein n=1 Tax=Streptomyces sp. CEV 2-1 TaxID=2485153 RepID=UPI000F4811D3|nr:VWA domain-containing protein [Streptomyces sp. CEV 2-1]ROQ82101.1 TerF-like vWA domain-containing protein [Streptomyces sp. CEV 2-1]
MSTETVRVVLVAPISQERYFIPRRKRSIAWYAERSLAVADRFTPGAGIEILLYGSGHDGPAVARTELQPQSRASWVQEWATRPNMRRRLLADAVPRSRVEEFFDLTHESLIRSKPLPAAELIVKQVEAAGGAPTLVIFWLDGRSQAREILEVLHASRVENVFWQFFGDESVIDSLWREEKVHKGQFLPHVSFHFNTSWSVRKISKAFSRWHAPRGA